MIAAFKTTKEARIPRITHCRHTTLQTAYNQQDMKNSTFGTFNVAVRDPRMEANQINGI